MLCCCTTLRGNEKQDGGEWDHDVAMWHWSIRWSSTLSIFVVMLWWSGWGAAVPLALGSAFLLFVNSFARLTCKTWDQPLVGPPEPVRRSNGVAGARDSINQFAHDSCGDFLARPNVWHARYCYIAASVLILPSIVLAGLFGVGLWARQIFGFDCTIGC